MLKFCVRDSRFIKCDFKKGPRDSSNSIPYFIEKNMVIA